MDINHTLSSLVDTMSKQILDEVSAKIEASLQQTIENKISSIDISTRVDKFAKQEAKVAAAQYQPNLSSIDKQLTAATSAIINNITTTANRLVNDAITNHIQGIDFNGTVIKTLTAIIEARVKDYVFPDNSINVSAIKFNDKISGDNIAGGTIGGFSSTGIEDKSSNIQVTILDSHTVVENHLLANEFTVRGTTKFEGDVELNGSISVTSPGFVGIVDASQKSVLENLNDELFSTYSRILFDRIKLDGIDLNRVTLNGEEIVVDKRLASGITGSNLQSVGVLSELQVRGETLIYNTLYTGNQRVGINTLEPVSALSIWDEEIEINIGKKQKDIGFIGSNRQQALILGTNNKINLMLNSDGSVTATKLNLGGVNITSSDSPPNYNAPRASIVFNSNPSLGGPMGWVSLGEARWANFGIIE